VSGSSQCVKFVTQTPFGQTKGTLFGHSREGQVSSFLTQAPLSHILLPAGQPSIALHLSAEL
jgi:hypothetical protein